VPAFCFEKMSSWGGSRFNCVIGAMPLDTRLYRSREGEIARLTVDRVRERSYGGRFR
jgi:hypothetical protein